MLLYGDVMTGSMQRALAETERRRNVQIAYNIANDITPVGIHKAYAQALYTKTQQEEQPSKGPQLSLKELNTQIERLRKQMFEAASLLEFEKASSLRDQVEKLEEQRLQVL